MTCSFGPGIDRWSEQYIRRCLATWRREQPETAWGCERCRVLPRGESRTVVRHSLTYLSDLGGSMENVVDGLRVVSLLSSATEWVYAVGAGRLLVGRSHECDVPPDVRSLPSCSEPLIDIEASSAEIDRQVKARQRDALSIYAVNRDRLRELRPDLVLTQMQCEVCAVTATDVERALCTLTDHAVRVLSLSPNTLAEVWESGVAVGQALGREEQAKQAVADCQSRLARLKADVEMSCKQLGLAPRRLLCLEWMDPPMAAGNWMPELMRSAGAEPVFGVEGQHSPWLNWNEVEAADPDVIVLLPCGWGLERTRRELNCVTSKPEWSRLRAVREGRVAVADGNRYFNRPGPRLVESAEILAQIVYPEAFPETTLRGDGWDWLEPGDHFPDRAHVPSVNR